MRKPFLFARDRAMNTLAVTVEETDLQTSLWVYGALWVTPLFEVFGRRCIDMRRWLAVPASPIVVRI